MPLENDPIMSGRLIRLFRHLERQNLSLISDSEGRARMVQQFWRNGLKQSTVGLEDVIYIMSKSVQYFRFYRQSQDGATILEESDRIGGGVGGVRSDQRSTIGLGDVITGE